MTMSASYFDLLKYAATGQASPGMTYYDKMRASTLMGGAVKTLTGIPPLSFKADGAPLISWSMKGNGSQSGTPTPDNPVMPTFCGVRTWNLFDADTWYGVYKLPDGTYQGTYSSLYTIKAKPFSADDIGRTFTFSMNLSETQGNVRVSANVNGTIINGTTNQSKKTSVVTFTVETVNDTIFVNYGTIGDTVETMSNIMLNLGSTALPYEPFGYKIPISCGGENLFDKNAQAGQIYVTDSVQRYGVEIQVPAGTYTASGGTSTSFAKTKIGDVYGEATSLQYARVFTLASDGYMLIYSSSQAAYDAAKDGIMLNLGSTAKPYAPYSRQTTPVYLGQVRTVRKIRKLVLTGDEEWFLSYGSFRLVLSGYLRERGWIPICSHYKGIDFVSGGDSLRNGEIAFLLSGSGNNFMYICDSSFATVDAWKSYLAAQYTAGTPVTVWYVLATEQTGIVNEPLCKIGDYADELHSTDAAVTISTVKGSNTLTVDTTLQPSEMSITYRG